MKINELFAKFGFYQAKPGGMNHSSELSRNWATPWFQLWPNCGRNMYDKRGIKRCVFSGGLITMHEYLGIHE